MAWRSACAPPLSPVSLLNRYIAPNLEISQHSNDVSDRYTKAIAQGSRSAETAVCVLVDQGVPYQFRHIKFADSHRRCLNNSFIGSALFRNLHFPHPYAIRAHLRETTLQFLQIAQHLGTIFVYSIYGTPVIEDFPLEFLTGSV